MNDRARVAAYVAKGWEEEWPLSSSKSGYVMVGEKGSNLTIAGVNLTTDGSNFEDQLNRIVEGPDSDREGGIVVGDFKTHYTRWGEPDTKNNTRGRIVLEVTRKGGWQLPMDENREHAWSRGEKGSIIYLTPPR